MCQQKSSILVYNTHSHHCTFAIFDCFGALFSTRLNRCKRRLPETLRTNAKHNTLSAQVLNAGKRGRSYIHHLTSRHALWDTNSDNSWTFGKDILDKSKKKFQFRHLESQKKKIQFNHWPFISGCICPGTPSFDLPTPNFAGSPNMNSVPGSGPGTES